MNDVILAQSGNLTSTTAQIMGDLRVALPAVVKSFDASKQTVTVMVAILERLRIRGQRMDVDPGLIADVPVLMPRAGGFSLTLPIQAGDECLLVFADGCIDAWWQSGGQQARISGRRHDLSDAFAIFGPWSQPRVLSNYSASAAQLRSDDGQTVIEVGPGEVTVKAAQTVTVMGQHVNVTGSQQVAISGNGSTVIEGKDFLTHRHVMGSGTTGPVV